MQCSRAQRGGDDGARRVYAFLWIQDLLSDQDWGQPFVIAHFSSSMLYFPHSNVLLSHGQPFARAH